VLIDPSITGEALLPPIIQASDALGLREAADMAAVSRDSLLRHAIRYGFAVQRGRKWIVSRTALLAWMADDVAALAAWRRSDMTDPHLLRYLLMGGTTQRLKGVGP
jgi:hypothetical protein